ncbi:hypothetical protein AB1283_04270 [Bacillus sp. S13(2024)]|uniref:hypothetical protein n=1 Tax=unclassified Bacillus (in: firmicutes) TaxID=185979 RepID=UPI003D1F68F4
MDFELNSLKNFIPFGSAIVGALTGGFVTYRVSKATERRLLREKRLESIFELETTLLKLVDPLKDIQIDILVCRRMEENAKSEQISEIVGKMKSYLGELYKLRPKCYSYAVHISPEVLRELKKIYSSIIEQIVDRLNNCNVQSSDWMTNEYIKKIEQIAYVLHSFIKFLNTQQEIYVNKYMTKLSKI